MTKQMVINVDLADVFAQPGRKEFLHTLAWGDRVAVMETTAAELRIRTTKVETQPDGGILPVKTEAFITPAHARETPQPLGTACNWPKLE